LLLKNGKIRDQKKEAEKSQQATMRVNVKAN
jgi:hypothetical protein